MTGILDKTILIGLGLEKRIKDALNELASEGRAEDVPYGRNKR